MENTIKFAHTNLIAQNWEKLAQFYIDVFGCVPVYPERDLKGEWIDRVTGMKDVHIEGIHLQLPGFENGPTLEIFAYENNPEDRLLPKINRYGYGHIAFHVDDVDAILDNLLAHGGTKYGQLVVKELPGLGILTVVYAQDPEGNIVEIQNWKMNL